LCVAYARLKQSDEAVVMCNKARAGKDSYSSTYYLAWSYLDLKKYPEAIAALQDCVRLGTQLGRDNSPTYIALAEAHFRLKRFKEALGYAQQAVDDKPDLQNGYVAMGSIYFEMKKLKDAKRIFEKALALPPQSASARYNLAMTCLAMKQKDCAREQYAILKTSEPVLSTRLLDQIYSSKVIQLVK
jgi:tetratricopeptide (TPR) repeat protein